MLDFTNEISPLLCFRRSISATSIHKKPDSLSGGGSPDYNERQSYRSKDQDVAPGFAEQRSTDSAGKRKRQKPIVENLDGRNNDSSGTDENAEDDASLPSKPNRNSGATRAQKNRRSSDDSARRSVGGEKQSRSSSIDENVNFGRSGHHSSDSAETRKRKRSGSVRRSIDGKNRRSTGSTGKEKKLDTLNDR